MRRSIGLFAPALVLAALVVWPAVAHPQDGQDGQNAGGPDGDGGASPTAERLGGTWRLAMAPERAEQVIDRAVDRAVDAMAFFVRPIARDRLGDGTPLIRVIDLEFHDDDRVTVELDGRSYTTPLGRTVVRQRPSDGERLRVTQRLRSDGRLEQVFQSDGGTRWYVYRPQGPDRLRVESTTDSERMPQPMRFTLEYRRPGG